LAGLARAEGARPVRAPHARDRRLPRDHGRGRLRPGRRHGPRRGSLPHAGQSVGGGLGESRRQAVRLDRKVVGLVVLLTSGRAPLAQEAQEPPSFGRGVDVVRVDVVVTDKSGNPVADLTRDDFTLFDEGQPQNVESFEAVRLPLPAPGEKAQPRPRLATNVVTPEEAAARAGRSFVLVFDNMHLTPLNAQRAKAAAAAFLDKGVREGDQVTLIATGGGAWWSTRLEAGRADLMAILKGLDSRRPPDSTYDHITDFEAMRIDVYQDSQIGARVQRRFANYGAGTKHESEREREKRETYLPGVIDPYVERKAAETYLQVRNRSRATLGSLERVLRPL